MTDRDPTLLGDSRVNLSENGTPGTRWNFTVNHNYENWRFLARFNYYGDYYDNEAGGEFDGAFVVDLEAGVGVTEQIDLVLGVRNVGDETGCSTNDCGQTPANILGLPSSQFSPFGFGGAFYYGKMSYRFE